MRAAGRPSLSAVARIMAVGLRISDANTSSYQAANSAMGSSVLGMAMVYPYSLAHNVRR